MKLNGVKRIVKTHFYLTEEKNYHITSYYTKHVLYSNMFNLQMPYFL